MDRQEYLNQISMTNRPVEKSKNKVFTSKFFWVGVIGVVAFIFIMIIGFALSGNNNSTKDKIHRLILHIDNTSEIIDKYQPNLKSSDLRSYSASLNSVLSDTNKKLSAYATEKYGLKESDLRKEVTDESMVRDALEAELFEAKINGNLDRVYAHKMAYEISLITANEAQILSSVNNDTLKESLTTSYNSLDVLHSKFNDFSETK